MEEEEEKKKKKKKKKKGRTLFWKQYRSRLWKRLKCALDTSNVAGARC
jgi:hypothetical protein